MQVKVDGKRNITLDFEAPKKFKLLQDGKEIPYLRTGKNSFRLLRNIDGVLDLEEIIEQPKIVKPMQLQAHQMALVNPNDVLMINQAAQQLEVEQNILGETQKRVEQTQAYLDVQQQRINETVLGVQGLETNNAERITVTENGLFNLAGNLATTEQNLIDSIGTVNNGLQEHKSAENPHGITKKTIGLDKVDNTSDMDKPISKAVQNALDEKADKDEIQAIRDELGEYQEKNDRFTNALSNYTGGLAGNQLPDGGSTGQILAKRTDMSGDVEWIDNSASITVDDELSLTSENPVQNKVITSNIIIKSDTIPTATADLEGSVYQYSGENGTYTHGYIYECQEKTNYTPRILFEPSKIGYNYDYDLLAFFQEATPNFAQIKEGIFQYFIAGDIWAISAKDENGNIIFDNYKLYTEDLQDAGFVFLEPSYTDEEEVSYELALNPSVSYEWTRIDVQPNQSAEVESLENRVTSIESKIPAQASSSNQLADKNFVNSSIATSTATFRGTFNSVAELEAYSGEKDNNDYAFVTGTDQTGNTYYDRYKYNDTSWVFEYRLNNSSFTSAQWAAINSNATAENIAKISANETTINNHIANKNNPHEVTKSQVGLSNVDNTSDLNKPISTATQTALNAKQDTIADLSTIRSGAALGATAVQPETLTTELLKKQDVLTAGTDIEIVKGGSGGVLPQGFQQLEYIEGNNNAQYINTDIVPTSSMNMYVKMQYISIDASTPTQSAFLMGARDVGGQYGLFLQLASTSVGLDWFVVNGRWSSTHTRTVGDVVELKVNNSLAEIWLNGTSVGTHQYTPNDTTQYPLFLNALDNIGEVFSNVNVVNRIYRFTIEGLCDMLPAIRQSDNAVGMYDIIRNRFFVNAGTGTFTAGPSTTLPTGYTQLTYLESQVSPTLAYIDTGINFNSSYTYELKYSKGGNANAVMGVRVGAYNAKGNFAVTYVTQSAVYSSTSTSSTAVDFGDTTLGIIHDIKYNQSQSLLTFDSVDYWRSGWINEVSIPYNIYLFAMNQANSVQGSRSSYARIYSYRVTDSNRVVQNLIPAKRNSDSVLGMYDTVNDVFYTNAGTGTFEAGKVVGDSLIINFTNESGYAKSSDLATVATSGSYNDLSNKPTIPTVNNASLIIQKNGTDVATFTANANSDVTANISVPTDTSDLTNGAGYITGISSSDVTTALGYTPYNSSNPNGYTSNAGTVTSVNDIAPDVNGNVSLSIPSPQINSDWNAVSGVAQILNKPTLATVATTGSYNDLSNKPTIPTDTSDLTNGAGYITSSALTGYATENYVDTGLSGKQATLVSGTNIKTINNQPLLGSGNITIGGAVDSVNGQTGTVVLTASDVGALPSSTVIPTVYNSTISFTQGGVTKGSFTLNQSTGATIALDAGGSDVEAFTAAEVQTIWDNN